MSILLIMNKHHLLFLLLRFVLHMLNIIWLNLKLYNNWSAQAVNSILESAMWNSSKPVKFAHLWKLTNQSTLNKAHVIKITKSSCTVTFRKARNSLVIRCREERVSWRKKQKMVKIYFNLLLAENLFFSANEFWITSKSCSWFNKVDHGRPSIKWPQWKGNDMLLLNAHPLSKEELFISDAVAQSLYLLPSFAK